MSSHSLHHRRRMTSAKANGAGPCRQDGDSSFRENRKESVSRTSGKLINPLKFVRQVFQLDNDLIMAGCVTLRLAA